MGRKPLANVCRACNDPIIRNTNDGKLTHERICRLCHSERIFTSINSKESIENINYKIKKYSRLIKILKKIKERGGINHGKN
ncbi:MAG TPA: hypothetical protein DDX93_02075 [Smithella sp.]|jgi:hypothetical protein|nr:hypothetical protein [Smithella sp.]